MPRATATPTTAACYGGSRLKVLSENAPRVPVPARLPIVPAVPPVKTTVLPTMPDFTAMATHSLAALGESDADMITFDEDQHRYFAPDGRELLSVTTLIQNYLKPPFNREAQSQRTAAKRGITADAVLRDWDEKRAHSQAKGVRVHTFIRTHLGNSLPAEPIDPFLQLNPQEQYLIAEELAFTRFWKNAAPIMGSVVHTEFIVGDVELGIAGTVDCVALSPVTGKRHVWDWKTGSFTMSNAWDKCMGVFGDLEASDFVLYSMQVSLYRLLFERLGMQDMGDSYILHLSQEGLFTVHKALDLRERLLAWLLTNPFIQPA